MINSIVRRRIDDPQILHTICNWNLGGRRREYRCILAPYCERLDILKCVIPKIKLIFKQRGLEFIINRRASSEDASLQTAARICFNPLSSYEAILRMQ